MRSAPEAGVVCVLLVVANLATAQVTRSADLGARVDVAVREAMARTAVPSASVGIVQAGRIVFTRAFGKARLEGPVAANVNMRYAVGSISKQFTAACILLLHEEGKLSLDDSVGKYLPELTRAGDVTLRRLLSHTSGYRDYAPQDYTIPAWTTPRTALEIVHQWATEPLDFDPGTRYEYSNTNFKIAGLIVERVSGEPFWSFLSRRVLGPLGMTHTIDLDADRQALEPVGYRRNALGPLRPAIVEAPGWNFADGELAMPVADLLAWDISLMNQSLLAPASYTAMETEARLTNGDSAHYGLGVSLSTLDGHRAVSHDGEVGGFVASNAVYPDDKIAVAVLTNQEAGPAADTITRALSILLLGASRTTDEAARAEVQAKAVLGDLQLGRINRTLFTADGNFYFDQVALDDYRTSLGPLGPVRSVRQISTYLRGGLTFRSFDVTFTNGPKLRLTAFTTADGKFEQFLVGPSG